MQTPGIGSADAPPRVLVVDDDPLILKLMTEILVSAGCDVATQPDGYHGIRQAREHEFDIVFLDVKMPVGGVAAVKEILDARPDAEIVLITGYPDLPQVRQALDFGARSCLPKPLEPRAVLNLTAEILAERRRT